MTETASARVAKSQRLAVQRGARSVRVLIRDPVAVAALDLLRLRHGSIVAAITAALSAANQ